MKENESDSEEEEIIINNENNENPEKGVIELQQIKNKLSLDEAIKKLKEKEKTTEIHNSYLYNIKDYIFFLV